MPRLWIPAALTFAFALCTIVVPALYSELIKPKDWGFEIPLRITVVFSLLTLVTWMVYLGIAYFSGGQ